MSDTLDRFGILNGGTGPKQLFCEDPTPHSNLARVDDGETTSVSTSEDYSDIFDWDAYYASGTTTDVTTQSNAPSSAGKLAVMPSAVTPAGAPPPGPGQDEDCPMSDPPETSNQDEDYQMQDAPVRETQPLDVWPKLLGPLPPRDTDILLEGSPSPSPPPEMHQKKTRVVKDREETGRVRELGACYPCRMNRKGCDSDEICEKCKNRSLSKSICIRTPLVEMIPAKHERWNWNNPSREQPGKYHVYHLLISCSDDANSPCLPLKARAFAPPGQGRLDIALREPPSETETWEDVICRWMEQQILAETGMDFEAEMDRLLVRFVRQARMNLRPAGQQMAGALLSDLFQLRCMWKVWGCKQLFFREQLESRGLPFDLRFEAIQDSLRRFASQKISELERNILPEIDKYIPGKETSRPAATETDVMKWFSSWQLMLTYRQSWSWVLEQQQTNAAPIPIEVAPMDVTRHQFRETTERLFEGIIVIYSGIFHKKSTVEKIRDADFHVFGADQSLHAAYQRVWQTLPDFYGRVAHQVSPTDGLFIERIVKKESKFLSKTRSVRK
ncbi:hypothetical protein F5144DRAFT_598080 [Chaetomium tenue]|uniref:Uncharacterized protein n=1 Tax=Chaetomium tenue TaxID=1854479 RepID=A0ACB7PQT6_9PEZI|nr:hypothetical protein F5144DRAFT_598080 [Chaetomium globosum]